MPLFICRWQNGDLSAVNASSREEAIELLDEVGNADVAEVFTAKRFMVHFQLKKQVDDLEEPVPVDFEGFGEDLSDGDIEEATIDGAVQRLRPELMTVTAVILSLAPILWESGIDSDVMKPIAAPIVGGMITST